MKTHALAPWNILQLQRAHLEDLAACQTQSERATVEGFHRRDLKRAAVHFSNERKLTPGEIAVLEAWSIYPPYELP